jgi:hypothetical protein
MAPLFPPPHKPLASPLDDLTIPNVTLGAVVPIMITVSLHDLCRLSRPVADPPYEDHAPVRYCVQALGAVGARHPRTRYRFFGNTSDSTAAQVGKRRMLSDAQTRIAQMMPSTNVALLSSTGQ